MTTDTIYEFRDYTLRPNKRDVLIDLFEREFIEPQEACGAHVRATIRDLDNPDRFVWMRSFANAEARYSALDQFYTGPAWQEHRNAANATMVDSDNVMQLRLLSGSLDAPTREETSAARNAPSLIVATAYFIEPDAESDFLAYFTREIAPALPTAPFATLVTDHTPNIYPRLPIRENESVLLTLTRFASVETHAATGSIQVDTSMLIAPLETRRLEPTARSVLR